LAKSFYQKINKLNMNKIENHSIFGSYSQDENRLTAAFLQVLKNGGTDFVGQLMAQIDEIDFPSSEINIITQIKENNNIYDAVLDCNFSFRVLVESKIKENSIQKEQLHGLIRNAVNIRDFILYITPDQSKPKILESCDKMIYWSNWKNINRILKDINTKQEPLNFLINEFEKFLEYLNLLHFVSPEQRVQIAAGSWGEPIALKYGFYACQNNRPTKESKYLAFYNNRGIHTVFEIVEGPINDCDLSKLNDDNVRMYINKHEPNYSTNDKRQFYRLQLINDKLTIKHSGKNKNGKNTAFTMGVFRYTTIDKLKNAKTTEEL
jgi:hypothetical protein